MHIQFFVPGLLWPGLQTEAPTRGLSTPALERLLGIAACELTPGRGSEAALLGLFGLPPRSSLAALRRLGEAAMPVAETASWLCADPVGLRFAREHLLLIEGAELDIAADEATALVEGLNREFGDIGRFEMAGPSRWYLRLTHPTPTEFAPLADVVGRPVAHFMPSGEGAAGWHRLINETQVWLHNHPVNQAREAAGRQTINSLWPWGGGEALPPATAPAATVVGDGTLLGGLCRSAGTTSRDSSIGAVLDAGADVLACFDGAAEAARHLDLGAWQRALAQFDEGWLAPAMDALRRRRLQGITLLAPGDRASLVARLERPRLWPVWKRPTPLQAFIGRQR
ncbi:MAG: hypothetical protein KDH15_03150 [Rhodocyclaceae bacterium]|nr:hypothetical protein [Rhodocyclaceae bacterium]